MHERVDFHVHYNHAKPETAFTAIDLAVASNTVAIALLERSTISPYFVDYKNYGKEKGVEVLTGIELATQNNGEEVGVVCIGFDPNHPEIQWWRSDYEGEDKRVYRSTLAKRQYQFLVNEGFSFESMSSEQTEELETFLEGKSPYGGIGLCRIASNLSENFQIMKIKQQLMSDDYLQFVNKYGNKAEYLQDFDSKFLYSIYFTFGRRGYFADLPSTNSVIAKFHKAGGVVLYSPEGGFSASIWRQIKEMEIDGILAWHGGRLGENEGKVDVSLKIIKAVIRDNLLILGGSDYQGKDWKVGIGDGNMYISSNRLKYLYKRLGR